MMEGHDPESRPFEELVLARVKREITQAARRHDRSSPPFASDGPEPEERSSLRVDILIGVVDCLRLLKWHPGFSHDRDFEAFAESLRIVWRDDVDPKVDRNERLWNCAIAALGGGRKVPSNPPPSQAELNITPP